MFALGREGYLQRAFVLSVSNQAPNRIAKRIIKAGEGVRGYVFKLGIENGADVEGRSKRLKW